MMSQPAPLASASDHHGLEQVSIINWNCCPSSIGFGVHFHRNTHGFGSGDLVCGAYKEVVASPDPSMHTPKYLLFSWIRKDHMDWRVAEYDHRSRTHSECCRSGAAFT